MYDIGCITYEEARKKLDEVNNALMVNPDNAQLWYEKGIYQNAVLMTAPGSSESVEDVVKAAELIQCYFEKSLYLGKRDLYTYFEMAYSHFVCNQYEYALNYLEIILDSDVFVHESELSETEKTIRTQCLYMAIHSYSAVENLEKLQKTLRMAATAGEIYTEQYISLILQQDDELLKLNFIQNSVLNVEKLHALLLALPVGNSLQQLFQHNAVKICLVLEEMLLFDSREEFYDKLHFFQESYKNQAVIRIFQIFADMLRENHGWICKEFYTGTESYSDVDEALCVIQEFGMRKLHIPANPRRIEDIISPSQEGDWYRWNQKNHAASICLMEKQDCCLIYSYLNFGRLYQFFPELELDLYFYKKSCLCFLSYDNQMAVAVSFKRYAEALVKRQKTGQALHCMEFAVRFLEKEDDTEFAESFYNTWAEIYRLENMPVKERQVWEKARFLPDEKRREKLRELENRKGMNVFFVSFCSKYKNSIYKIKIDGDIDLCFGYANYFDLYDNLLGQWKRLLLRREHMNNRDAGNEYLHRAYAIVKHLIRVSILAGCYDFAVMHLEEFRNFDLKRRMLFLKKIRNIREPALQDRLKWIDQQFRRLNAKEQDPFMGALTEIYDLNLELERMACRDEQGEKQDSGEAILLFEFFYDDTDCWSIVIKDNTIVDVLVFKDTGKKKISGWADRFIDLELYQVFCSLPGGKLCVSRSKIAAFDALMEEIDQCFEKPVRNVLNKWKPNGAVLIPFQIMHGLPLHILGSTKGKPLYLEWNITYSPSEAIYRELEERVLPDPANAVFLADSRNGSYSLPLSAEESGHAARKLSLRGLETFLYTGREASYENACLAFAQAHLLHIGCHSFFCEKEPEKSGIFLWSDEDEKNSRKSVLTLEDFWEQLDLHKCQFVNLSSCYSGMTEWRMYDNDEFVGLMNGCLYAGVQSVLVNMANVNDAISYLLNEFFYEELSKNGFQYASALYASIAKFRKLTFGKLLDMIRDLPPDKQELIKIQFQAAVSFFETETPFAHPVFWSSYRLIGRR